MEELCPELEDIDAVIQENTGDVVNTLQRHNDGNVLVSLSVSQTSASFRYAEIRRIAEMLTTMGYDTSVKGSLLYVE